MSDIISIALSGVKFVPIFREILERRLLKADIESMRAAAAQSPAKLAWRAQNGTREHKTFERMVNAKLVVRSALFPNTYELPSRYH